MVIISGEANDLDLYSDCLFLCGLDVADTTSFPLKDFIRSANFTIQKATRKIIKAKNWQHNDFNNATELIDKSINLISGTNKYAILITWLRIGSPVRVKDSTGNWITIKHKERNKMTDNQLAATGTPTHYDKIGNFIYLFPTPNYTSAGSVELQYQTGATELAFNATTTIPGFPVLFHRIVSIGAAIDYCRVNIASRVDGLKEMMKEEETDMILHYETRDDDEQPNLGVQKNDYGEIGLL